MELKNLATFVFLPLGAFFFLQLFTIIEISHIQPLVIPLSIFFIFCPIIGAYIFDQFGFMMGATLGSLIVYLGALSVRKCELDSPRTICAISSYIIFYYNALFILFIFLPAVCEKVMSCIYPTIERIKEIELPKMNFSLCISNPRERHGILDNDVV